jgi:DNA-binding transcriptional regulator LsrR (DeoR family)
MRQIIEVLRLKYEAGLSHERIARASGLSKGVVGSGAACARLTGPVRRSLSTTAAPQSGRWQK